MQLAYIQFDKVTVNVDKNYTTAIWNISNTPDKQAGIFNYEVTFHQTIIKEQQRIKLSSMEGPSDRNYSHVVLSTYLDSCKVAQGVIPNFIGRIIFNDVNKKINVVYACPFVKDIKRRMNSTVTDALLPPIPYEHKFRFEDNFYGIVNKKKGWVYLYGVKLYARVKK